jgi:hypothetical protein
MGVPGHVTILWKDYAHGSKRRTMTLTHEEFLRRFLEHVLPRGLPRIRYFGFLANRRRSMFLTALSNPAGGCATRRRANRRRAGGLALPRCQGIMRVVEFLTAQQIRFEEARQVAAFDTS